MWVLFSRILGGTPGSSPKCPLAFAWGRCVKRSNEDPRPVCLIAFGLCSVKLHPTHPGCDITAQWGGWGAVSLSSGSAGASAPWHARDPARAWLGPRLGALDGFMARAWPESCLGALVGWLGSSSLFFVFLFFVVSLFLLLFLICFVVYI